MQIIKEIKEAEKQAKQIVADAEREASKMLEKAKNERFSSLDSRKLARREAIDLSVESAANAAQAEAEKLTSESAQACKQIGEKNNRLVSKTVDMVIGFVEELPKK